METPFDNLIHSLWQMMLNTLKGNAQPSEFFLLVNSFSKTARVLYINMLEAAEKMLAFSNTQHKYTGTRTLSLEEMLEMDAGPIRCTLSYMQFIEHINRTGRVLHRKGFTPPYYARIRFFRNKTVEHWDEYIHLRKYGYGDGLMGAGGKVGIPIAFAGISMSGDNVTLQKEITDEFARYGVSLPSLTDKWYEEYSDIIYPALEKIDSELGRYSKSSGVGIPETLVTLLFKYSFPTPIYDVEEYCKTLVTWMGTLPLL